MIEELHALADGKSMGRMLYDNKRDRLKFRYEETWRDEPNSFPLSLSMPLAAAEHEHKPAKAFIWGLLPDSERVLQSWGRKFQVSPRNPFRLISHVGEECAGAIQFVRPERVDEFVSPTNHGAIEWLSETDLAIRLKELLVDHSATRSGKDTGQFSLAGAQPKTALHFDPKTKRWGVPSGRIPTTHILKPATGSFEGYAENEHFCLSLAREVGLSAAASKIQVFGHTHVIVVERYDRIWDEHVARRVHQEDVCQALAHPPQQKYENEGGPSAHNIIDLIRENVEKPREDEWRFVEALIFNWLIVGTDAHAKNYSLLIAAGGQVRLAPLYDISSALVYPQQVDSRHAKLAMKIGGKYKVPEIGRSEWNRLARDFQLKENDLLDRIQIMAQKLPEACQRIAEEMRGQGITHDIIGRLAGAITGRSAECLNEMGGKEK